MKYKIREMREQKGITQDELSEKSGITRATLWRLESGEVTTTKTLMKIADALDVSVSDLFFDKSD